MDCPDANPVFLRQLRHRLSGSVELGDLPLLAVIKARRPTKPLAQLSGSIDAFIRTFADQATLKLGDAAHDGQH